MAKKKSSSFSDGYSHLVARVHKIKDQTVSSLHSVLESIESERKVITEALDKKAASVRKHLEDLGVVHARTPAKPKAASKTTTKTKTKATVKKPKRVAKAKANSPTAEQGKKAIAYLAKKSGQWIEASELALHAGTVKVAAAIGLTDDGASVQKRGPGRKRQYLYKGK